MVTLQSFIYALWYPEALGQKLLGCTIINNHKLYLVRIRGGSIHFHARKRYCTTETCIAKSVSMGTLPPHGQRSIIV